MAQNSAGQISNVDNLLDLVKAILSDINIGLLIYHVENPKDESRLKLVYANQEAFEYTESDLQQRVGKYIHTAFPALKATDLPKTYLEVMTKKEARQIGVVEYADQSMRKGAYSVKAFPLPANCVGVVFEDIAIRKQVDELVKKRTQELNAQYDGLSRSVQQILAKGQSLKKNLADSLSPENRKLLDEIVEIAGQEKPE